MNALRIYDPAECDSNGVPLDWERCRRCNGEGVRGQPRHTHKEYACPSCNGHSSLKATALVRVKYEQWDKRGGKDGTGLPLAEYVPRCEGEDCGHPMSEGTWEPPSSQEGWTGDELLAEVARCLPAEPVVGRVHFSPCDGCRHSDENGRYTDGKARTRIIRRMPDASFQASWRNVDVRCLGWPHDLRPEKLSILCLRCWAERDLDN